MKKIIIYSILSFLFTQAIFAEENLKSLVVYFSHTGTTQKMANYIAEMTKADIFRLESAEPYPAQYKSCTVVAREERDNKIYRKIKSSVNLNGYETIFIGVPVWWHTCPMIVQGWILQNQKSFEGKTVIPFCTYASTFRDETLSKITELTPKSIHKKGLGLTNPTKQDVKIWLDSIKK